MTEITGIEVVGATAGPIHDFGSAIFLSPETFGRAATWGWSNPFAFYFAGRGGVLGEVSSEVVTSAFGWFSPEMVATMYAEGLAVGGSRLAAERMFEAHALWGGDHLSGRDHQRFIVLAERLIDHAEGGGLPLFVGWRTQTRADDPAGRTAQLLQILREWRGSVHLVATTAVGLSPLEAILTNEGEGQATFFGWSAPFPDVSALAGLHQDAQAMTDRLCATQVEQIFTGPERAEFAELVAAIQDNQV